MERITTMERAKMLAELKQQIAKSKQKNYIRHWRLKDGKPFLESEKEFDYDTTVNFTGCLKKADAAVYKQFDLEQLAAEQRKEVNNGRHEQ
jgi:hypothetical protein